MLYVSIFTFLFAFQLIQTHLLHWASYHLRKKIYLNIKSTVYPAHLHATPVKLMLGRSPTDITQFFNIKVKGALQMAEVMADVSYYAISKGKNN